MSDRQGRATIHRVTHATRYDPLRSSVVRPEGWATVASGDDMLTVDIPADTERAVRRDERRLVARLAQAHVDQGDLLELQRFIKEHGDKAAQRGLALFVGFLTSFGDTEGQDIAA